MSNRGELIVEYPTKEAWDYFMRHHDEIRSVVEQYSPDGSYGMFAGVVETVEEIMQLRPDPKPGLPAFVFYFDGSGGQYIIAEWGPREADWVSSEGPAP